MLNITIKMIVKISSYKQLCFCHAPLRKRCAKLFPWSLKRSYHLPFFFVSLLTSPKFEISLPIWFLFNTSHHVRFSNSRATAPLESFLIESDLVLISFQMICWPSRYWQHVFKRIWIFFNLYKMKFWSMNLINR